MTHTTHTFDRAADVHAALADPALVPDPPAAADGHRTGGSVPWLRAASARFSTGETHRRRRALVEAELARLDPAALHRAAAGTKAGGGLRERVVRALAEAMGLPEPEAVARDVTLVAAVWFGGEDPAADAAVARLVSRTAPDGADAPALEATANRIGLLVQACAATATLVESAAAQEAAAQEAAAQECAAVESTAQECAAQEAAAQKAAAPEATAPEAAAVGAAATVPLARVLRETPPVPALRRVAARATHLGGRAIAEGDVVLLDVVTAQRGHPAPLTFGASPRVCPGRAHALALAEGLLGRPRTPFAALHHRAAPLLLPNAWDYASAAALAAEGFPAIGTTSLGVAAAAGLPDGAAATAEDTLALARRLGRGSFLFSVDAEGGFSDDPAEVAELARRLHEAGAAGINLEDGRPDGTLAPAAAHAAKIAAVKAAVPGLFVNARTDTHWLGRQEDETAARLAAYEQAGADGVFVPGLADPERIAALAAGVVVPLNILHTPTGPTLAELAALGVRRVSLGSLLYRTALAAAVTAASAVRDGGPAGLTALSYARTQALGATGGTP
ncbi:isocitrate lyase/phosphoenolpyruvate mutase family protein [Streptomyces sp. NPDC005012]|uniref:isocitrate lyase/PEP mutase family protein n=1 Tax=Streptomyces sp. NPDC005012 TaxID=3154558 RepID=UPI0033A8EE3D